MKSLNLAALLLGSASALAVSTAAFAQTAAPTDDVSAVVVTGSRLVVNGNNSPTPVAVLTTDTMRTVQPTTLAEGLGLLPVFAGNRTQSANPSATGAVGGGNGAANQLNLRGVGSYRNLILMDGRRVPPASTTNIVDVDIVPELLVQRVDVVTGGVSAVYGSDAVSGVVNYVIDRNFNGLRGMANYGISEYGDSRTINLGIAAGTKLFGDRGHIEGSFTYYDDEGVLNRTQRSWYKQQTVQGLGTPASPYRMVENVRLSQTPFGGLIVGGPLNDFNFATDGVLTRFVHGTPTGSACCEVGGDGGYFDSNMRAPLRSKQVFGRFDYELTDSIHFFATGSASLKSNQVFADELIISQYQFSSQNAFLTPAQRTQFAAAGTSFRLSKILKQSPRYAPQADTNQYVYTVGLDGKVGGWNWAATYWRGVSNMTTGLENVTNLERLAASLDAVAGPNGSTVCNTDITNPGLRAGCVPLNVFGPTASSQAAIDYILGDTTFWARTRTHNVTAEVTGSPFSTWAGPVQVAFSGEHRTMSYEATTDGASSLLANCTGLRFNCTQGTTRLWSQSFGIQPRVSQTVTEGAGEINLPLLQDSALARELSVTGAARYTHYNTSGNYWTWKVGLDWRVIDDLRFRGTVSRDIRAPTLDDLFSVAAPNFQTQQDLLTGLSPRVTNIGGGNPDLTAEIGHTLTGGAVWRPSGIPGFTLSVDAYRLKITDAILAVQGFNPVIQRACYASGGSSPYCQQQIRPNGFTDTSPANAVQGWRGTTINIGSIKTWGVDVEANYATRLFGRPASFRGLVAWQPHIYYIQPALPTTDMGGVAFGPNGLLATPKWRLTGFFHIDLTGQLGLDLVQRWHNSLKLSGDTSQTWIDNRVDSYGVTNATLTYTIKPRFAQTQLFFNVQNLFNTVPPIAGYFGNVAVPGVRDGWIAGDNPIGRFFTVGARFRR